MAWKDRPQWRGFYIDWNTGRAFYWYIVAILAIGVHYIAQTIQFVLFYLTLPFALFNEWIGSWYI